MGGVAQKMVPRDGVEPPAPAFLAALSDLTVEWRRGEYKMRKTIQLEVEVTMDESLEQRVIAAARQRFDELRRAAAPNHERENLERVAGEEVIPNVTAAMMELIGANDLLEELGVEFSTVSGHETFEEVFRDHEIG
jgi:hypothetical protein